MKIPRPLLALGVSLVVHVVAVVGPLSWAIVRDFRARPLVDVELVEVKTEPPKELPLGPMPAPRADGKPRRASRPRPASGGLVGNAADAGAPDAGAPSDAGGPRDARPGTPDAGPRGLRTLGPEGSRLVAMIRLDRLRSGPDAATFTALTDEILLLLPDRRRLLEGSGLDLYRDFDALLLATPNPFDSAVTFLVVRHHVSDDVMRAGLDRAAVAAGRPITWRTERGRPIGTRAARVGPDGQPVAERDDRVILLAARGLVVVAAPAYSKLLLASGTGSKADFSALVARIDAEETAMPDDAIMQMSAANVLGRGRPGPATAGLPPPEWLQVTAGTSPALFARVEAQFAEEPQARAWEDALPEWRRKAQANPFVVLGGFAPLVGRVTSEREGSTVTIRTTVTRDELERLINMARGFLRQR